jgi:NTP pyrophosphatase (non-canonical NTP hydrolase)
VTVPFTPARSVDDIRPSVLLFAYEMENRLRANDDKRGWTDVPPEDLLALLDGEVSELGIEILERPDGTGSIRHNADRIRREAADVANYAMMIAEVAEHA